jgi:hypothetical protein
MQRRFAYEHPLLLDREPEGEDEEEDDSPSRGTNTPSESIEPDDISRPPSSLSGAPRRKRKRVAPSVPLPQKGTDFWSMVDQFFIACMRPQQLGIPWSSPKWIE